MCESPIVQGISWSLIPSDQWSMNHIFPASTNGDWRLVMYPESLILPGEFNLAHEKGHGEKSTIRKRNKWVFSYTDKPQIIDGR